ncbi:MAG: pilus assembly protein PilM [Patescibacteria group bacterium]
MFKKILKLFSYQPLVGGLEINDLNLRFAYIKKEKVFSASVKLEPETIKDGKIQNRQNFIKALSQLHSQIASHSRKKICVIATIPDNNVYAQIFNLPESAETQLEEAAKLNLQMISPIDFERAYSDWQAVGKSRENGLEILGAFIQSELIDELDDSLREAGFVPVAIEFSSLSLARLASELGEAVNPQNPFILFNVGANGLSFSLIKNSNLYFNHFVSWQSVYGNERRVAFESFKKLIVEEIKKVLNFSSTHWGHQTNAIFISSHGLIEEIAKIVSQNFSFNSQILTLKNFKNFERDWFLALGAALRGLMPRFQDSIISLSKIGTEKEFYKQQTAVFLKIWRNIALAFLMTVLIIFISADGFLAKIIGNLNNQFSVLTASQNQPDSSMAEFNRLQKEVADVNKEINLAVLAYESRLQRSELLENIKNKAGDDIVFKRISIQSPDSPIFINGLAQSEQKALEFKGRLVSDSRFSEIELPISKIIPSSAGVEFAISFKFR